MLQPSTYLRARIGRAPALLLVFGLLLLVPAVSNAATAPTLRSPASNASATEGNGVTYDWTGSLQGAAGTTDRSFFRVEIADAVDVPSGQQAVWPTLVNLGITDSGTTTTQLSLGAPDAGSYRWRVCAWGVADPNVDLAVEQLSCSSSRALTTKAATTSSGSSSVVTVTNSTTTTTSPRHVQKIVTTGTTSTAPKEKVVKRVAVPHLDPRGTARFESTIPRPSSYGTNGTSSSVSLGNEGLNVGANATGAGAFGFITSGLGSTLPGIPIPFWSLAIFLIVVPLTHLWRRSLLDMFEWPEEREARLLAEQAERDGNDFI